MAQITPVFDMAFMGSGQTSTKDDWFDISLAQPNPNSPIPAGKQLWIGYITVISEDKQIIFEIRSNLPTKSAGNANDTQLRAFASCSGGESQDIDLYSGGDIIVLCPMANPSSGVEKLWLRVRSGTGTVGAFDYIVFYALY